MANDEKVIDLSGILKGLGNKWVVLSKDESRVLAVADTLEELQDKIQDGIVMKVPDPDYEFVPVLFSAC